MLITAALSKAALLKKHEIESVIPRVNVGVAQATIRPGYSEKTAEQVAFNLFKKVEIQNAISEIGIAGNC